MGEGRRRHNPTGAARHSCRPRASSAKVGKCHFMTRIFDRRAAIVSMAHFGLPPLMDQPSRMVSGHSAVYSEALSDAWITHWIDSPESSHPKYITHTLYTPSRPLIPTVSGIARARPADSYRPWERAGDGTTLLVQPDTRADQGRRAQKSGNVTL